MISRAQELIRRLTLSDCVNVVIVAIFVIFLILVSLGYAFSSFILVLVIFLLTTFSSILFSGKRIILSSFLALFLFFLLSRPIIELTYLNDFSLSNYALETQLHVSLIYGLAIFFIWGSYILTERVFEQKMPLNNEMDYSGDKVPYRVSQIRKISLCMFSIFAIFSVIISVEKSLYVYMNGYLEYYSDFDSQLPYFFYSLSAVSNFSFFIYLATLPSKSALRIPLLIYVLVSATSLLYGKRGEFVLALVIIFSYVVIRKSWFPGSDEWLPRKTLIILAGLVPILVIFLSVFGGLRSGEGIHLRSDIFFDFFYNQSLHTSDILAKGYEMKDKLDNGSFYTLGPIEDLVTQNKIYRVILDSSPLPDAHTVARATDSHFYADSYMYYLNPEAYKLGHGRGSTFIAEAFQDFEYLGVIFVSIIYGFLLALCPWAIRNGPLLGGLYLVALGGVLYSPRASASDFITQSLTMTNIGAMLLVALVLFIVNRKDPSQESASH